MRNVLAAIVGTLFFASVASAQGVIPFSDNFDPAPQNVYVPWPGTPSDLLGGDTSHALSDGHSARAFATDPGNWTDNYRLTNDATNGAQGTIVSDVWVWDDNSVTNSGSSPVNAMLAYVGANGTTTPGFGTDYAELGIISGNTASLNDWVVRVRSYDQAHGTTWFDTGVSRASLAQTWAHLEIVADALPSQGGDGLFHFYINGNEVVSNTNALLRNTSVGENWTRIGSNSATHQDFWYDNFSVTPEPSSVALLGLGVVGFAGRRARRRA